MPLGFPLFPEMPLEKGTFLCSDESERRMERRNWEMGIGEEFSLLHHSISYMIES